MMSIPIPETDPSDLGTPYADDTNAPVTDAKGVWQILIPIIVTAFMSTFVLALYILPPHGQSSANWIIRIGLQLRTILIPILPMAAILCALLAIFKTSGNFFISLYKPPSETNHKMLILNRLFGFAPHVVIRKDKFDSEHEWVKWLGGPASLVVYDGFALYVEGGNRFSRIIGPGITSLDSSETVKEIVDLRPIVRPGLVKAWTKDGIQIQMDVRIECQIGLKGVPKAAPTKLVYPFNPIAVKKAVERTAVRYDQEKKCLVESNWVEGVWGKIQGSLATYISSHTVDELFLADWGPSQILSQEASIKIINELNEGLQDYGAHLSNLQITNINIPEEVKRQRIQNWEAERKSIATVIDGRARATGIREREKARAEAEQDITAAIAKGLERIDPDRLQESLLLSLSGILDQSLSDPITRAFITNETLDTLEKLKNLL